MLKWLIASAMLASAPAPVEEESVAFGEAAGWNVQRRTDGCFMMSAVQGSLFGFFMHGSDGSQLLIFHRADWRLSEETRRDFALQFDGTQGSWQDLAGNVTRTDDGNAVLLDFDETARNQLLEDFGTGSTVRLFRGGEEIGAVSLAGAPQGLALLQQCLSAGAG